jgi:hypothetical protein
MNGRTIAGLLGWVPQWLDARSAGRDGTGTGAAAHAADFAPIFIVGCPRSGTTLLTVLMDRHDRIAMTPETHFIPDLPPDRYMRRGVDHGAIVDYFLDYSYLWDMKLDRARVLQRFRGDAPTFANFFRRALEEYASGRGKVRVGEKSPEHLGAIPTLVAWYPRARILWLVRDGRDAVQAMMRAPQFHKDRRRSCHLWRSTVLEGLNYQRLYPENVLRVDFKELVRRPREELGHICRFVGEEFQERQLDVQVASSVVLPKESVLKGRALQALDHSKIGEYHRQASVPEIWLMDSVMGRCLRRLGYPPAEVPPCPWPTRLGHWLKNLPLFVLYHPPVYRTLKEARKWRAGRQKARFLRKSCTGLRTED